MTHRCDQALRHYGAGAGSPVVGLIRGLVELGVAWLALRLPGLLAARGVPADQLAMIMGGNAGRALRWRRGR